jgi:hypothetical protein
MIEIYPWIRTGMMIVALVAMRADRMDYAVYIMFIVIADFLDSILKELRGKR